MLELLLLVAQLLLCVLLFVLRGREQLLIECGLFVELFLQLIELVLKLLLFLLQGAVLLLQLDGVVERACRRGAEL